MIVLQRYLSPASDEDKSSSQSELTAGWERGAGEGNDL